MKKLLVFFVLLSSWAMAQAQWSVGLDARLAPWGDGRNNAGSDLVINYKLPVAGFFVMPSAGLFYKKYIYKIEWVGYNPSSPTDYKVPYKTYGYQTGFDLACVVGKGFNLGVGELAFFTGPRYAYAFARSDQAADFNRNSFDWRIGASYSIWKFTASAKVDIACLKFRKGYDEHQVPVLAIGLAYNF